MAAACSLDCGINLRATVSAVRRRLDSSKGVPFMAAAALTSSSLLRNPATILRAFNGINKPSNSGRNSIRQIYSHVRYPLLPHSFRARTCVTATNNEEASAKAATAEADTGASTIFDKIISKEIPSTIVYEDERVLAFRDINPQAPVHVVIIPKFRDGLTQLGKAEVRHGDILGHLLYTSKIVAEKEGILDGFRVVINNGPGGCQSVYHLHLHVLGGRQMKWPPG